MPDKSSRAQALDELYHMRKRILIEGDSDSDAVEEAMEENLALNLAIQQCRYFERPLEYRNKSYNADTVFQEWLSERRILTFTHMSRRSYEFIYNLIRSDARFVNPSATSPSQQRSVFFQLFVALTRLTGDGDAGCVKRVCELFNIGTGTVGNYTRRCIAAINAHADTYIFWPNSRRRAELSAYADSKYGFPGFIGSCDGTVIGLRRAPSFAQFPETYRHPRHGVYGYNVLFWADHFGTIMRFTCNWPASAADQTIFNTTTFALQPQIFLKLHEEFIFVDLGFKRETFAVPPYKGAEGKLAHNAQFNIAQRKGRVKVEHVNGVIKSRFASLKRMPIEIRKEADHAKCSDWITACVILHNLLIQLRDEHEYELPPAAIEDEAEEVHDHDNVTAKMFQNAVRDRWLRAHGGWE